MDTDKAQAVINALYKHKTVTQAAKSLGIPRSTFHDWKKRAEKIGIKPRVRVTAESVVDKKVKMNLKQRPLTGVYFCDAHNQPKLDKERFRWLGRFINDVQPDVVIDGGDFDDFPSLCSHERNDTWTGKFKPSFREDIEHSREAHDILDQEIKCEVVKHKTLGNHEHRLWDFEDRNPEVYGMMQHAYTELVTSYGWNLTPYRDYLTIDGIDFTHAPQSYARKPVGGKNVINTVGRESVRSVVFGHTHKKGEMLVPKMGPDRGITIFNGGCYFPEDYRPDYARGGDTNYWHGAHKFTIENGKINIKSYAIGELRAAYE